MDYKKLIIEGKSCRSYKSTPVSEESFKELKKFLDFAGLCEKQN